MDKKTVFDTLGIEATKDTNNIKKAYRGKLVQVNPEDNPEGFKLLREAYEEAVRLSNIEEEETSDTPITKWVQKVADIYSKRSSRVNVASWREVFDDEVCKDFDTSSEALEALLIFLMDHYRLPGQVWKVIQDTFQLNDFKESLYEKFPVDFVDFITEDIERKDWMDYIAFEGDDGDDIDEFINLYLAFRRMNSDNQYDEAEDVLRKLKQINLWHPYLEVEKIRYFIVHKRLEEAKEIVDIFKQKKCEELYVKYYIAEFYIEYGELENAYAECTAILEVEADYFGAKVLLCDYYLKKEEYKEAKERYLELLEIDNYNEHLREGMQKANVGLIETMKVQLEKDPGNRELRIELGWSFYQNRLFEEAIELVENVAFFEIDSLKEDNQLRDDNPPKADNPPRVGWEIEQDIYYDYNNLLSRIYLEQGNYEKGFPYVQKWLEAILNTEDDGTEKTKRRFQRLGLAYYFMSKSYYHFAIEKEDNKDEFNSSIEYIDLAVKAEDNTSNVLLYLSAKAQVLLKMGEEKRCIDVCDEVFRTDKGYYPVYLIRQEAYYNLNMYKEVIDDYHNAIEIYARNPSPYKFAVEVYHYYDRWNDAQIVLDRAKDAEVESKELLFLELKNRRYTAENNEQRKKVAEDLEKFYEEAKKEPGDLKDVENLLHEQAQCYVDMKDNKSALKIIEKKLELSNSYESLMLKGDILYSLERYETCIRMYKEMLNKEPERRNLYYSIGLCYNTIGVEKEKEALECFQKVVADYPNHLYVYSELTEIYKRRYQENYKQEDYELAVQYGKQQVEINPNGYYYTDLGLVYLDGYDMEEAIKAFEQASKYNDADPYPYNNSGYAYKVLGDFDRAYEFYKLAIERIKASDFLPYRNMAVNHRSVGQYEKAIEIYEMISEKSDNTLWAQKKIMEVYKQMGHWTEALEQVEKIFNLEEEGGMEYLLESGNIYSFDGKEEEAFRFYKQAIKKYSKKSMPYLKMGDYMLWIVRNKKKALRYYKKAYRVAKIFDMENQENSLRHIVNALKELGKEKKASLYAEKINNLYMNWYGSVDGSLNNPEYRKVRLYYIALLNYNIGDYQKAQHYIELMKKTFNCTHCTYRTCYELLELEAMMLELKKDYAGALEKYQQALSIAPDNLIYYTKIKELKENK